MNASPVLRLEFGAALLCWALVLGPALADRAEAVTITNYLSADDDWAPL